MKYIRLFENDIDWEFDDEELSPVSISIGDRFKCYSDTKVIYWNNDRWSSTHAVFNGKIIDIRHSSDVKSNPKGNFSDSFKPIKDDCYVFTLGGSYWPWFKYVSYIDDYIVSNESIDKSIDWEDFDEEEDYQDYKVIVVKYDTDDYWLILNKDGNFNTIYYIDEESNYNSKTLRKERCNGIDIFVNPKLGTGVLETRRLNNEEIKNIKQARNPYIISSLKCRIFHIDYLRKIFGNSLTFDDSEFREYLKSYFRM